MTKKILSLILLVALCATMAVFAISCKKDGDGDANVTTTGDGAATTPTAATTTVPQVVITTTTTIVTTTVPEGMPPLGPNDTPYVPVG